jgi:hypothetical protein
MELSKLKANVQSLNFKEELEIAVQETAKQAANLQRDQMLHGLRSTGEKIGKYRSKAYASKKFQMNSLAGFGFKDERLTGDFYREFVVDARPEGVHFTSADPKTKDIVSREGEDIFGLTKSNAENYGSVILAPVMNKNIKKHINGL